MTPESWLDTAEKLSRMLSIAAVPVVLAVGGWLIQRQLQDRTIRRDYVQLALSILQNPDPSKVSPEIREWAVDLLNYNSPTKLNAQAMANLKSGKVTLAGFSFVPSTALTPELENRIQTSLENFKAFMAKLGFQVPPETISVNVKPGTMVNDEYVIAWDSTTNTINVPKAFANDDVCVLRQFAHSLLVPTGEWDYCAVESGLATYFPCSFIDSPKMGDKATAAGKAVLPLQDLRKYRKFSEIKVDDWASVQNDGSEVWGGVFWEIRELVGREVADRLIADTWQASSAPEAGRAFLFFAKQLLTNSESIENGKYTEQIRQTFKARGLKIVNAR